MIPKEKKPKKEIKRECHNCMLCGWCEVCTTAEWMAHIKEKHSELYVPRATKKGMNG